MTKTPVCLNADCGESFGAYTMGDDAALFPLIDAANIACGFHAGDPLTLREALRRAKASGVGVGAHPSYPDLAGFGRRFMALSPAELEAALCYQIAAIEGMARREGLKLDHVKPHGALNNAACASPELAKAVAEAIRAYDPGLILLAPALSHLASAGRAAGLKVVDEIFADRGYLDDAQLAPRGQPGAMIHDAAQASARVLAMLAEGAVITLSGQRLPTPIGSICVHGDGPGAIPMARHLREALQAAGHPLVHLPQLAH